MKHFIGFVMLGAVACVASRPPPPQEPERILHYRNEAHMLTASNGMKILVAPDASTNLVGVDLRVQTGSVEDPQGKSGLALLVQNLMFEAQPEGSNRPTLGAQIANAALDYHAYTTWDYTHFRTLALADSLGELLRLEMLLLGSPCETITPDMVEREKAALRAQLARRDSEQGSQIVAMLIKSIYPKGHPYRRNARGAADDIAKLTMKDVCIFMTRYYTPDRVILVVTGNTTPDEVNQLLFKHIQTVHARLVTERPAMPPSRIKRNTFKAKVSTDEPVAFMTFPRPPRFAAGELAASIALDYLENELDDAAEKESFVTGSGAAMLGGERAPVSVVWIRVDKPDNLDRAVELIHKVMEKLHQDLGREDSTYDIETTRQVHLLSILRRIEPLVYRGDLFADHVQFEGTIELVESELGELKGMTLAQVRQAVAEMADHYLVLKVTPDKARSSQRQKRKALEFSSKLTGDSSNWFIPVDTSEAGRSIDLPPRKSSLAATRTFTLDNGMTVMLFASAALPVVDIRLIFSSGSVHEPADQAGLAEIAGNLLRPRVRSFAGYVALLNFYRTGSRLKVDVDHDTTSFQVRGLAMYYDVMLRTLAEIVGQGRYDKEQVKELLANSRKLLEKRTIRRGQRYMHALREAVFGARHPYTRSAEQSKESLARINAGTLGRFKNEHYRAANATLIVTGNFEPDLFEKHVRYWFAPWSGAGASPAPVRAASQRDDKARFIGVGADTSESQVNVVIAYPTTPGAVADASAYAARLVAEKMVRARMYRALNRLGVPYDLSVAESAGAGPGIFMIDADIPSERTGEALAAMRAELDRLRAGDDFDVSFVVARRKVVQELLAAVTDSESVADRLAFVSQNGLGVDFYDKLVEQAAALAPEQVKELMAGELAAQRETVICLGGRADIESAYAEAGIRDFHFIH